MGVDIGGEGSQNPPPAITRTLVFAGGDLHYHLSQHGVFSEKEMRFYAAEIILGLEHMHNRFVVYRDLKVCAFPHGVGFFFSNPSLFLLNWVDTKLIILALADTNTILKRAETKSLSNGPKMTQNYF